MNNWRLPNGEMILSFFGCTPTLYRDRKLSLELREGKEDSRPAFQSLVLLDGSSQESFVWFLIYDFNIGSLSTSLFWKRFIRDMQNSEQKIIPWSLSCGYYGFQTESEISWMMWWWWSDLIQRPVHCTVTDGYKKPKTVLFSILSSQIDFDFQNHYVHDIRDLWVKTV